MQKIHKLAVFFDGTWNTADYPNKYSNVKKLKDLLVGRYTEDEVTTITESLYLEGPGTRPGTEVVGGAFAVDLAEIIAEACIWLSQKYYGIIKQSPEPDIYVFGFSRGAYLAHIFSWLLNDIGLTSSFSSIPRLVERYMHKDEEGLYQILEQIPPTERYRTYIQMLGLWDMVSAPFDFYSGFRDGERAPIVRNIYHAMALDEKRRFFPVLKYNAADDCICQRWFSGVHSDVGGGYDDATLSDISLEWMIDMSVRENLIIKDITASAEKPGTVEDFLHMDVHDEAGKQNNPRKYEGEEIDGSVYRRMAQDRSYTPIAVNFPMKMA